MSLLVCLAIYQDPEAGVRSEAQGAQFLNQFLDAFERVMLSGQGDAPREAAPEPLEEKIARIHLLFDAESTPEEFLHWLAGWVALALRSDLSPSRQRRLLANIAHLYRIRGTRRYLEEILKLRGWMPRSSVTDEDLPSLQIARHSTVGTDTYLGGGPSFLFQVKLAFSQKENDFTARQRQLAREVIELERPAHTWYELRVIFPRMQLGVHSTVGVDTVLAP